METKVCKKCCVEKPIEEYSRCSKRKTGRLATCKKCYSIYFKSYREKNRQILIDKHLEWLKENPSYFEELRTTPEYKAKRRQYLSKNKKRINKKQTVLINSKYNSDPFFRLQRRISGNILASFKRALNGIHVKEASSLEILGCSMEQFVEYISTQFTDGMTLENQGEWHLDHIIPISSAKSKEDIYRLCHFSNYQPLWAADNLKKGAKIIR